MNRGKRLNPYTRKRIQPDVWDKLKEKKDKLRQRQGDRGTVHELILRELDPIEALRRSLAEKLDKIQEKYQYLPYDRLMSIERKTITDLGNWLRQTVNLRYSNLDLKQHVDRGSRSGLLYLIKKMEEGGLDPEAIGLNLSEFYASH